MIALYVHYLYVLGKIEKRQYPPQMKAQMKKDVMRAEHYREQFVFLAAEKAELYGQLAQVNRDIRAERKQLGLCREIQSQQSQMERTIERIESRERESHIGHRGR